MHILAVGSDLMYHLLHPACEQLGHTLGQIPEDSATTEALQAGISQGKPRLLLAFADWSLKIPWADLLDIAHRAGVRTAIWNIEDHREQARRIDDELHMLFPHLQLYATKLRREGQMRLGEWPCCLTSALSRGHAFRARRLERLVGRHETA